MTEIYGAIVGFGFENHDITILDKKDVKHEVYASNKDFHDLLEMFGSSMKRNKCNTSKMRKDMTGKYYLEGKVIDHYEIEVKR